MTQTVVVCFGPAVLDVAEAIAASWESAGVWPEKAAAIVEAVPDAAGHYTVELASHEFESVTLKLAGCADRTTALNVLRAMSRKLFELSPIGKAEAVVKSLDAYLPPTIFINKGIRGPKTCGAILPACAMSPAEAESWTQRCRLYHAANAEGVDHSKRFSGLDIIDMAEV